MKQSLFAVCALALVACGGSSPSTSDDGTLGESGGMLLAGKRLSEGQVATLLRNAGFAESTIPEMVCTAKYESSFYDRASNHNTNGSTDYGLFQINSVHLGDKGCTKTSSSLYDTTVNTHCAKTVFDSQGIRAWYGYQKHATECSHYKVTGDPGPGASTGSASNSSSTGSTGSSSSSGSSSGSSGSSGSSTDPNADPSTDPNADPGTDPGTDPNAGTDTPTQNGAGCWSATLQQEVEAGGCVNSAYETGEFQCIDGLWYNGVTNGVGKGGPCTSVDGQ